MRKLLPRQIVLLLRFLFHVVAGVVIFLAIATASVAVWEFTKWIKGLGVPLEIWLPCQYIGDLIFGIDSLCAAFFLVVEGWKLLRDIAGTLRQGGETS